MFSLSLFNKKHKTCLGIDFGSSGIRIVQLSSDREGIHLGNYILAQSWAEENLNIAKLSAGQLAALIKKLFERAGIKSRQAVISLPVGETFSTVIDLPQMTEQELAQAIPFEARKYVPVPIEQVILDWSVVGMIYDSKNKPSLSGQALNSVSPIASQNESSLPNNETSPPSNGSQATNGPPKQKDQPVIAAQGVTLAKTMQILIVAVPQELIKKISQIAKIINLEILALEQEAFSIVRSLARSEEKACLLADLGEENMDLVVIDEGTIRMIYTFKKNTPQELIFEASKIIQSYETRYSKKINKILLTGRRASDSKWLQLAEEQLKIKTEIGNPFAGIVYDQKLGPALKEISPLVAVAVGGAMREI